MKTNSFISRRLNASRTSFHFLTSETSCFSYFHENKAQGLGPGPWRRARAQGLGPEPGPRVLAQGPGPGPGPRARAQGLGPGPEPTGGRKLLKIFIKKTRSAILRKKKCLTAPHPLSQTTLSKKHCFSKSVFLLFHVPR